MFTVFCLRGSLASAPLKFTSRRFSLALSRINNGREPNELEVSVREIRSGIHPSAIVHPDAVIGNDVSVGPFCTVGPHAQIGDSCQLHSGSHIFGDTKLGENCTLFSGAIVGEDLPGRTLVGNNNVIGLHASVGIKCQDMKYKLGDECFLRIGNGNVIREYTSIHRSSLSTDETVIGDGNFIMGSCHIAHDCKVGNFNIFANNTLLAGHVVVHDHTHTAGATAVHQFCHINSFSFIGGGSVVSQDVPMYMMVTGDRAELRGLNTEGLRRNGFSVMEVKSLKAAYRRLFLQRDASGCLDCRLMELEQHEELGRAPAVRALLQSIRESFMDDRRGICKIRNWNDT